MKRIALTRHRHFDFSLKAVKLMISIDQLRGRLVIEFDDVLVSG